MSKYTFNRISKETVKDLIPVFTNAFGRKITLKLLYNKINTFYTPVNFLGFIGYFNNVIPCSYYGVYPMYAYINEEKTLISQSGDTMTHGDHVGNGLFIKAAELSYQLCMNENVVGVFGFPSNSSFSGFKNKLNWTFNQNINNYTFKIPTLPISYLSSKNKILNIIYLYI